MTWSIEDNAAVLFRKKCKIILKNQISSIWLGCDHLLFSRGIEFDFCSWSLWGLSCRKEERGWCSGKGGIYFRPLFAPLHSSLVYLLSEAKEGGNNSQLIFGNLFPINSSLQLLCPAFSFFFLPLLEETETPNVSCPPLKLYHNLSQFSIQVIPLPQNYMIKNMYLHAGGEEYCDTIFAFFMRARVVSPLQMTVEHLHLLGCRSAKGMLLLLLFGEIVLVFMVMIANSGVLG